MLDTRMPAATSATVSNAPVANGCTSAIPASSVTSVHTSSQQSHETTAVLLRVLTKHQATGQVKHLQERCLNVCSSAGRTGSDERGAERTQVPVGDRLTPERPDHRARGHVRSNGIIALRSAHDQGHDPADATEEHGSCGGDPDEAEPRSTPARRRSPGPASRRPCPCPRHERDDEQQTAVEQGAAERRTGSVPPSKSHATTT